MFTRTIKVNNIDKVKIVSQKSQEIKELFGKNLKFARKSKGMTQDLLGEKLDVKRNTVSMWESANSMPTHEMIESILDVLDISRDKLFGKVKYVDVSNQNLVKEPTETYAPTKNLDIFEFVSQLEESGELTSQSASILKEMLLKLYKERASDKEKLIDQFEEYNKLRDFLKKKHNLPI